MDAKEYISSGILEIYVMGSLSPEEMKEVENMASSHPEIAEELKAVQNAVNSYSGLYGRNPRPGLRDELMQKIEEVDGKKKGKIIRLKRSYVRTYKYLIAACIAALMLSTGASVFFFLKWSDAADQYVTIRAEKNQYAQDYNLVKFENEKMNSDMAVLSSPSMNIITLNAKDSTKNYMARVYWNKYSRETFIYVHDLPAPAADKQYQLWALAGGKPIDAGVFNMGDVIGMQKVKSIYAADAWAVTMEPKGGSAAPTMDQMYLISKI